MYRLGGTDMNAVETIHSKYPTMTKKQRILADYMLANPESMCFMTMKDLAAATNVSEMTILHACAALGYANYNELKYEFRKYLSERNRVRVQQENEYQNAAVPEYELNDKKRLFSQLCQEEFDLVQLLFNELDADLLFQAAEMLMDANLTVFCARGVSMQIAEFLSMRLATMGLPSVIMNTELNDSIQSLLPLFNSSTLVVPISLPDYYLMTSKVCEFANQRHTRILCLTDATRQSPVIPMADLVLTAPCTSRLFLNTPAPMLFLANLLSAALNIEKSARRTTKFHTPTEFAQLFSENCSKR